MPSQLGRLIRETRQHRGLSLRALARSIEKSPAYIVALETSPLVPGIAEETIIAIGTQLDLDPDLLLTMATKMPAEMIPTSPTELALYRLIKGLSPERQERLRAQLKSEVAEYGCLQRKPKEEI